MRTSNTCNKTTLQSDYLKNSVSLGRRKKQKLQVSSCRITYLTKALLNNSSRKTFDFTFFSLHTVRLCTLFHRTMLHWMLSLLQMVWQQPKIFKGSWIIYTYLILMCSKHMDLLVLVVSEECDHKVKAQLALWSLAARRHTLH